MADFLDALSPEAEKRLKSYHNEVLSLISDIGKANAAPIGGNSPSGSTSAIKALTDQVLKLEEANSSLQAKYVALAASQKNNITLINGQAGATSKNTASTRENAISKQILRNEEDRNFRSNTLLAGAYARASAQLLTLKKTAKDYAISLGEAHPKTIQAAKDASDLGNRIKSADAIVGDFQRNVGNYSGGIVNGFKSMFSYVRQLAYILPGIGIAGIFNLALEPLTKLIEGLGLFNDKFLELRKNFDEFRESQSKIRNETRATKEEFKSLYDLATNPKAKFEEQSAAVRKLKRDYSSFFGAYEDGAIKSGKAAKEFDKVNESIAAVKIVENSNDYKKKTEERIDLINQELKARQEDRSEREKLNITIASNTVIQNAGTKAARNVLNEEGKAAQARLDILNKERKNRKQYLEDKKEENIVNKSDADLQQDLISLGFRRQTAIDTYNAYLGKSLLLEKDINHTRKEGRFDQSVLEARIAFLKQLTEAEKEAQAAERQRITGLISEYEKVAKNEKSPFESRIDAYGQMLKMKEDLAMQSYVTDIRMLTEEQQKEEAELQKSYNKRLHDARGHADDIQKIKAFHEDEMILSDQKWASKRDQVARKFNKEYLDMVEDTSRAEIEIQKKRDEVLQKAEDLRTGREEKMFKDIADNENLSLEVREQAFLAQVALEHKRLDLAEIREKSENPNNIEEITEKYKGLREELEKLESPYKKTGKAVQAMYDSFAKTLTSDIFKGANLGSFEQFFDGSFKKTLDGFDSIKDKATKTREKAAYAFVQIAKAAQEAFNFINQAQEQQFQAQIDRLGREKEVALGFAGESADAREEIERQYTERVKQLRRQEAEAQKRNAIFNILINTAQGIAATYGQLGFPAAIPFIAAIGIIGAAQAALVASQPIPEFEKGTDNAPIGWAKVDEKGAEIHTDKNGRLKSLGSDKGANYRWLDKGDKIYTAEKSREMLMFNNELNGILSNNGISSPIVVNNGISEEALTRAVIKGLSSQSQGDSFTMVHDARGIKVFQQKQNRTTELMNNKKSFTAKRIR